MAVTISNVISGLTSFFYAIDPSYGEAGWSTATTAGLGAVIEAETGFRDAGYVSGPVQMEYASEQEMVDVEQDTFKIKHLLKAESLKFTINMAEAVQLNLQAAMAGVGAPASDVITIGAAAGSTIHHLCLRLIGTGPGSLVVRRVYIPKAYATGNVGIPFTKGGVQMIPVEFTAVRAQESGGDLIPVAIIADAAS